MRIGSICGAWGMLSKTPRLAADLLGRGRKANGLVVSQQQYSEDTGDAEVKL